MTAPSGVDRRLKLTEIIRKSRQAKGTPKVDEQITAIKKQYGELIKLKDRVAEKINSLAPNLKSIDDRAYNVDLFYCIEEAVKDFCKILKSPKEDASITGLKNDLTELEKIKKSMKEQFLILLGRPKKDLACIEVLLPQEIDGREISGVTSFRSVNKVGDLLFEIFLQRNVVNFAYYSFKEGKGSLISGEMGIKAFAKLVERKKLKGEIPIGYY